MSGRGVLSESADPQALSKPSSHSRQPSRRTSRRRFAWLSTPPLMPRGAA